MDRSNSCLLPLDKSQPALQALSEYLDEGVFKLLGAVLLKVRTQAGRSECFPSVDIPQIYVDSSVGSWTFLVFLLKV